MSYVEIAERIRRSAIKGQRLHLEHSHAVALMNPRIYALIAQLEAEEIQRCLNPATDALNDTSSDASGSGSDPASLPGRFVGSTREPAAPSLDGDQRVSLAVQKIRRHGRR